MKYFILILGIASISLVTIFNFYPKETKRFLYDVFNNDEFILATENNYFINNKYKYIKNYTDDPKNKTELLEYIYYVINSGSTYADGECHKDYDACLTDLNVIANDETTLSTLNNFVHPYNSFKSITLTFNEYGKFSVVVEHIYSEEQIAQINYAVDDIFKNELTNNMTTEVKIKTIHDYIINNTEYDSLKTDDIHDSTYKSNTAYGVFIEGFGICSGYADAIAIMLNRLNIDNYKICNENHIWNLVHINGVWTHLDATWDDPVSKINVNRDTYFLIDYKTLNELDDKSHSFNKNIYQEAY